MQVDAPGTMGSMKIAIPVWENKVSPVFDTASRLMVFQVEDGEQKDRFEAYLDECDLTRRCVRIQGMGVDTIICGAISRPFSRLLTAAGVSVIAWISGSPDEVLRAYLSGALFRSKYLMPGCDDKHR